MWWSAWEVAPRACLFPFMPVKCICTGVKGDGCDVRAGDRGAMRWLPWLIIARRRWMRRGGMTEPSPASAYISRCILQHEYKVRSQARQYGSLGAKKTLNKEKGLGCAEFRFVCNPERRVAVKQNAASTSTAPRKNSIQGIPKVSIFGD